MSFVRALRELRRRPRLLIGAFMLALLVGVAIPYRLPSMTSRQNQVGIASASALVDSARSQVADLGDSTGSDVGTLAYRASLLASLMTSEPLTDQIAQRAGIAPGDLIATGPSPIAASNSPAPAVSGASISSSSPKASTLTASVPTLASGQIPVIEINTQAPTPAIAAKLANGAFAALQAEINTVAGTDKVPALQRVVIRPLGPAAVSSASQGPGMLTGVGGAIAAFLVACGAILGISRLRAAVQRESALESMLELAGTPDDSAPQALRGGPGQAEDPFREELLQDPFDDHPADGDDARGARAADVPAAPAHPPRVRTLLSRPARALPHAWREGGDEDSAVSQRS